VRRIIIDMQKALTYLIFALIIFAVVVGGILLFSKPASNGTPQTSSQTSTYGGSPSNTTVVSSNQQSASATTSTLTVAAVVGSPITVNDFTKDPQTAVSADIPDHYFLVGGIDAYASSAPYSIYYVGKDQSFSIILLSEPIADNRQKAEQQLMQKIGISQLAMCRLRYYVSVPNDVNSIYAGKNLGFSFCPGAIKL
jgi:hypothetical protein